MSKAVVIFDMDGVLLDSETLYFELNRVFFRELGAAVSEEEHRGFVGMSATGMWSHIREKYALLPSIEELKSRERELKYKHLSEASLEATDGIPELLGWLKREGHPRAIASSSLLKNIDLIVDRLGIRAYFDWILSGEQVARGKPAPDIFLRVAGHFGRSPGACIVIEDSQNGVSAAKAAGMRCIGYINPGSGGQDLSAADLLIDSFRDPRVQDFISGSLASS